MHFIKLNYFYIYYINQHTAMTDLFKFYHSQWENRVPAEIDTSFFNFLAQESSLEELEQMFNVFREEMNSTPCCGRHSGSCPVAVNSTETTPFVGGNRCERLLRQNMRFVRRAYFLLAHGEQPTNLRQEEPEEPVYIREI